MREVQVGLGNSTHIVTYMLQELNGGRIHHRAPRAEGVGNIPTAYQALIIRVRRAPGAEGVENTPMAYQALIIQI